MAKGMRQIGFFARRTAVAGVAALIGVAAAADRPALAQETPGTCLVIRGNLLMRNQPCVRSVVVRINAEGREEVVATHAWPAGSPTVITSEAEVFLFDGEEAVPAGGTLGLSCVMNRRNEVFFCFFETP